MAATIALARAGGTTGEWAGALREVFGEYRAPDRRRRPRAAGTRGEALAAVADRVTGPARRPAPAARRPSRASTATPTAPSRSRWPPATPAWRSSTRASASRPAQIAAAARDEDPDVIGLSILSGSHLELVPDVIRRLRDEGVDAAGRRRRDHPRGGPRRALAAGVARGLHAQGLRAGPHHGRHRRPGRVPPRLTTRQPRAGQLRARRTRAATTRPMPASSAAAGALAQQQGTQEGRRHREQAEQQGELAGGQPGQHHLVEAVGHDVGQQPHHDAAGDDPRERSARRRPGRRFRTAR